MDMDGSPSLQPLCLGSNPSDSGLKDCDRSMLADHMVLGDKSSQLSFRDIASGHASGAQNDNFISDLDVSLGEEDVVTSIAGSFPEIRFSNHIHEEIDAKLSKSLIVRLLVRSIGFRALKNQNNALWCPKGEINVIDLDNDYYLVRSQWRTTMNMCLLEGRGWCMANGNHLMVQPWSREFFTSADHPKQILAWLHLPSLSYRYYCKSLLRATANMLGVMVRIDFNTSEGFQGRFARLVVVVKLDEPLFLGIVIDGEYQPIEYEGLSIICFGCGKYDH
ncbi:hypothetical protein HRI_005194300 [Hibiscus trionum]|uniref:DUF4283 domain-containing protein n=1 Tax=Hibiscus trionum TaxID=183268 RepID=A0A9W7MXR9_HIBTR|nr:hypothetical protein HRI_005194300 [Hibiscus trionum]